MQNDAVAAVEDGQLSAHRLRLFEQREVREHMVDASAGRADERRLAAAAAKHLAQAGLRVRVVLLRFQTDDLGAFGLRHGVAVRNHEVGMQTERPRVAQTAVGAGDERVRDAPPESPVCNRSRFRARLQKSARAALGKLPFLQILYAFIEFDIAFVARFRDFAIFDRRKDGAALFLDVGTAGEFTLSEIGRELRKGVFKVARHHEVHLLGFERGKARRVRDIAAALDRVQLDMARGMAAAADAVGNRADLRPERAVEAG